MLMCGSLLLYVDCRRLKMRKFLYLPTSSHEAAGTACICSVLFVFHSLKDELGGMYVAFLNSEFFGIFIDLSSNHEAADFPYVFHI